MMTPTKPLRRRPQDGKIAGVCAGIADYFEVDIGLVRAVTASLILLGPTVVALYIILWITLDEAEPEVASLVSTAPAESLPQAPADDVVIEPVEAMETVATAGPTEPNSPTEFTAPADAAAPGEVVQ